MSRAGSNPCDEVREIGAIVQDHRRARFVAGHESARHGAKEIIADKTPRHRISRLDRGDQRDRDIVAIDGETTRVRAPLAPPASRAGGARDGSRQCARRKPRSFAQTAWRRAPSIVVATAWAIAVSARRASFSNTGHSGTSLSHSTSVGVGPRRAMTCDRGPKRARARENHERRSARRWPQSSSASAKPAR